jgi:hypothetical protein
MQTYKVKDRSLAVLVVSVCHHEMGVGEALIKHVPVEAALGVLLQLPFQLAGLGQVGP